MTGKKARSSSAQRRRTATPAGPNRTPLVVGGVAVVVVTAVLIALALSSSTPTVSEPAASPVAVSGTPLPPFESTGNDPAVGLGLPSLTSIGLDGQPMTIEADGRAKAVVLLAHWCPHCQAEVPLLVEWMANNPIPEGVDVVGVTTAIDPARPNFPPSEWLAREGWEVPTLIDDAVYTAYRTLGSPAFPGFVFVNANGTVYVRMTGEIDPQVFGQMLEAIAP
jgi:thiol-disulfide isomerase/thioredoxin